MHSDGSLSLRDSYASEVYPETKNVLHEKNERKVLKSDTPPPKPKRPSTTKSGLHAPSKKLLDVEVYERYELLFKAYEDAEDRHMEDNPADRKKMAILRKDPKSLLDDPSEKLKALAEMRQMVMGMFNPAEMDDDEVEDPHTAKEMLSADQDDDTRNSESSESRQNSTDKHNVSQVWADRLGVISAVQGKFTMPTSSSDHVMTMKKKWPDWLVDEKFEVVKVNSYGKRYNRTLKLTQYHVLAASEQGITKVYEYGDVGDVLVSLTPGEECLTIKFNSDNKSYKYFTSMSAVIAQQITTRIQVRKQLDSSSYSAIVPSNKNASGGDRPKSAYNATTVRSIMNRIDSSNQKSKNSVAMNFAEALVEKLVSTENETNAMGKRTSVPKGSSGSSTKREAPTGTEADELKESAPLQLSPGAASNGTNASSTDMSKVVGQLLVVEPNSKEYFVEKALQNILFESHSREANTRTHFINKVKSKKQSGEAHPQPLAQEVRMWVEGMHEYLLKRRGPSLASILLMVEQNVSQQITTTKEHVTDILNKHIAQQEMLERDAPQVIEDGDKFNPLTFLSHDTLLAISYLTFSVVEESVFLPLKQDLYDVFNAADNLHARDAALHRKMKSLQSMSQTEWSIQTSNQSPLEWRQAVFELQAIELLPTPSQGVLAIVSAAKSIFAEYEANNAGNAKCAPLGADDLVPIFIYVLVKACPRTPLLNKDILWSLCQPSQLYGECGYYLTVYESALMFIESYGTKEQQEQEQQMHEEREREREIERELKLKTQQERERKIEEESKREQPSPQEPEPAKQSPQEPEREQPSPQEPEREQPSPQEPEPAEQSPQEPEREQPSPRN